MDTPERIVMLVVGLTGGIASGKTTVSRMVAEAGVPVICADELAREAVEPGSPALEEIRREFGPDVIDSSGRLDRTRMAEVVFQDPAKRAVLESIIHPRVAQAQKNILEDLKRSGHALAVVDVPLLYEKGWDKYCDVVLVAYVPPGLQERRLMQRDNMSREEARSRLAAQMPIAEKKKRADLVVDNTGTIAETRQQMAAILKELEARASGHERLALTDFS
jgi:dephospho-CoA kinase